MLPFPFNDFTTIYLLGKYFLAFTSPKKALRAFIFLSPLVLYSRLFLCITDWAISGESIISRLHTSDRLMDTYASLLVSFFL